MVGGFRLSASAFLEADITLKQFARLTLSVLSFLFLNASLGAKDLYLLMPGDKFGQNLNLWAPSLGAAKLAQKNGEIDEIHIYGNFYGALPSDPQQKIFVHPLRPLPATSERRLEYFTLTQAKEIYELAGMQARVAGRDFKKSFLATLSLQDSDAKTKIENDLNLIQEWVNFDRSVADEILPKLKAGDFFLFEELYTEPPPIAGLSQHFLSDAHVHSDEKRIHALEFLYVEESNLKPSETFETAGEARAEVLLQHFPLTQKAQSKNRPENLHVNLEVSLSAV